MNIKNVRSGLVTIEVPDALVKQLRQLIRQQLDAGNMHCGLQHTDLADNGPDYDPNKPDFDCIKEGVGIDIGEELLILVSDK